MMDIKYSEDDFFIIENDVSHTEQPDYSRTEEYIRTAEAFSRLTYQSVYIIDYYKKNFLYVSSNSFFLCGMTPEEILNKGYRFYLDFVPVEDQARLIELNRVGFNFYNSVPVEERREWYIQYDFHIINDGHPMLIHHKLTPISLTSDGRIWLALCIISLSNHTRPGQIEIHRIGSADYYEYNSETKRLKKQEIQMLTEGEKKVVRLSIKGFTMQEIAEEMHLSADTIKKYRRQILKKLNVRNITEAIIEATNNKMI